MKHILLSGSVRLISWAPTGRAAAAWLRQASGWRPAAVPAEAPSTTPTGGANPERARQRFTPFLAFPPEVRRINDSTRVVGRARPARRPAARTTASIVAAAVLALLAAACSGSPSSAGSDDSPSAGGSSSPSAVAYAACMRSHGVPNYPDPDSEGNLSKGGAEQFGVSQSQYQSAQQACQHLLPTGGSLQDQARQCTLTGDCPPALVQQMLRGGRIFARCTRSHGVPKFPDPKLGGPNGTPMFPVSEAGLSHHDTHSSRFRSIGDECQQVQGAVALPMG
jgi:hypothetical protein